MIRSGASVALMTAVITVALAIIVSMVFGGESRRLFEQSVFNGEEVVDHAIISRCETAQIVLMLKDIGEATTNEALAERLAMYPEINTENLPCDEIITGPFTPGSDFGIEGPDPSGLPTTP